MGSGVAQKLAQTHHQVVLVDVSDEILERAKAEIRKGVRFGQMLAKSAGQESPDEVLARITPTTDYGLLKDVDFVVENVVEKWEIKEDVYAQPTATRAG